MIRPQPRFLVAILAATLTCALAGSSRAGTGHAAETSAPPGPARTFQPWDRTPTTAHAAHLRAEMIQRQGGEWVIVNVDAKPLESRSTPQAQARTDPRLQTILREYERAFDERDPQRLARVWVMNPVERSQVENLFRSPQIDLTIVNATLTRGSGRAVLEFDQLLEVWRRPARSVDHLFHRSMAASDGYGDWDLEPDGS